MKTERLEAFSDGVMAIIITIMVLELKVPHDASLAALRPLVPVFFSYLLSFVFIGIYWNNHHHLLRATKHVSAGTMWANLHLLFWLSLVPFTTSWMGVNGFASRPTALYGVNLLLAAIAFTLLVRVILRDEGVDSSLRTAIGAEWKGKLSLMLYVAAVPSAFVHQAIAGALYVAVACMWLIPDRRIEEVVTSDAEG